MQRFAGDVREEDRATRPIGSRSLQPVLDGGEACVWCRRWREQKNTRVKQWCDTERRALHGFVGAFAGAASTTKRLLCARCPELRRRRQCAPGYCEQLRYCGAMGAEPPQISAIQLTHSCVPAHPLQDHRGYVTVIHTQRALRRLQSSYWMLGSGKQRIPPGSRAKIPTPAHRMRRRDVLPSLLRPAKRLSVPILTMGRGLTFDVVDCATSRAS
ncbi:hypothetical protein B0H11DRAFT_696104 [Mycena galericulata]|nr:hypothetical protein B0H11DRAFT_696104 [Mycena galericulata]